MNFNYGTTYTYHAMAKSGNIGFLISVFDQVGPENAINMINEKDPYGYSVFHRAIESGKAEMVKMLIGYGADVNAPILDKHCEVHGWTPIRMAVALDKPEIIKILVENSAEMNAEEDREKLMTPLRLGVLNGKLAVAKMLLELGANVTELDPYGRTLLHLVAENGNLEMMKLLIKQGCDPNVMDKRGEITPAYLALENRHFECLRFLFENGADPFYTDQGGFTYLQHAARLGDYKICKLLLELGCDRTVTTYQLSAYNHVAKRNQELRKLLKVPYQFHKKAGLDFIGIENLLIVSIKDEFQKRRKEIRDLFIYLENEYYQFNDWKESEEKGTYFTSLGENNWVNEKELEFLKNHEFVKDVNVDFDPESLGEQIVAHVFVNVDFDKNDSELENELKQKIAREYREFGCVKTDEETIIEKYNHPRFYNEVSKVSEKLAAELKAAGKKIMFNPILDTYVLIDIQTGKEEFYDPPKKNRAN